MTYRSERSIKHDVMIVLQAKLTKPEKSSPEVPGSFDTTCKPTNNFRRSDTFTQKWSETPYVALNAKSLDKLASRDIL